MPQNTLVTFTSTLVGVLLVALFTVSLQWYEALKKNQQLQNKLYMENSLYKNQLNEFLKRYDSLYQNRSVNNASASKDGFSQMNNVTTGSKTIEAKGSDLLKASNVSVRGVQVQSNNILETSNADKINQMRIRFTLENDCVQESEAKKIVVQMVNLQEKGPEKFRFASKVLSKNFFKDSSSPDACLFIDLKEHLKVGAYKVNLICDGNLIGSTNFRVN